MSVGDKDMENTADAAERLSPVLEKAAADLAAELRSRRTPMLSDRQWEAFDSLGPGRDPRGGVARALEAAGFLVKAGLWYSRTAFGDEIARRRREGAK